MNRRDLIAGAAGLAGARVLGGTMPSSLDSQQASSAVPSNLRVAPAHPRTLRSKELAVVFDPHDGLPYSYSYKGQRLWGEHDGVSASAILCRLQPRAYSTVLLEALASQESGSEIVFPFKAIYAGRLAASFALRYTIKAASLVVTLASVEESAGFQLIEVSVPKLVTVLEEDGPAWMAEGRHGGSFVRLEEAKAFSFPEDEYFGRISTELPAGMVGQSGIGCVMEVTAFHDGTQTAIEGAAGYRQATLGTIMTHRVHGGRCYNMNDGGPPVCGNAETPNLLIEQQPLTRLISLNSTIKPSPGSRARRSSVRAFHPIPQVTSTIASYTSS